MPEISPERLDEILRGCQIFQILLTAINYRVFNLLREPKTADQLSKELGTRQDLTEKFLNCLVACGLLSKSGNQYVNMKMADVLLVEGEPFYQGHLIKLVANCNNYWSKLCQALKSGENSNALSYMKGKEIFDEDFILAHAEAALRGDLQRAVKAVAKLPEFKNAKTLLDLGGGHGLYAISFAQLNPNLKVFVYDLPHIVKITDRFIQRFGMQGKIEIITGDFTRDPLGYGYDIIFASDVEISGILGKIRSALNQSGILIYRRWVLEEDKASPLTAVLFDLMLSIIGSDYRVRTLKEYVEVIEGGGFSLKHVLDVSTAWDPSKIMIFHKKSEVM